MSSAATTLNRWTLPDCRGGCSSSEGDTFWQGLQIEKYCEMIPNGLPLDHRVPSECPSHRRRVEKAKRDIQSHRREFVVRELAGNITDDQARQAVESIRKWALT